jgi:Family of unknown function (DUF5670)
MDVGRPLCASRQSGERPGISMAGSALPVAGMSSVAARGGPALIEGFVMLYTVAMVLLVLWVLGLVTSTLAGGLLHVLLVVAVVIFLFQMLSGRRA